MVPVLWTTQVVTTTGGEGEGGWLDPKVVVAVVAVLVTILGGFLAWRRGRRAAQREQASFVTAWCEQEESGRRVLRVRNSSGEQINNVVVSLNRQDAALDTSPKPKKLVSAVDAQVVTLAGVAPTTTATIPVDISRLGNDVRPLVSMHFEDANGRGWSRNAAGRLLPHRGPRVLTHNLTGPTRYGAAENHYAGLDQLSSAAGAPVSRVAYSTHLFSSDLGNQVTIRLIPADVEAEVVAEGRASLNDLLKVSVFFDHQEHLIALTLHNVENAIDIARNHRITSFGTFDYLILEFQSDAVERLDDANEIIQLPLPRGGGLGEALFTPGGPLLLRIVDAQRRMHPEFWSS